MTAFSRIRRPAGRFARSGLVRFVRRVLSFLLRRVAYRRGRVGRIRAGDHFLGKSARKLPIVVVFAQDLDEGDAERLASEVESAQISARSFRPLFVIDTAEFAPFRQRGYVVERVMPKGELAAANPHDDHELYIKSRLEMIVHRYGTSLTVAVGRDELDQARGTLARELVKVATG